MKNAIDGANRAASYAKRWAAKEAAAKALGTGMNQGVAWRDIEVVNLLSGQPTLKLTGGALARLRKLPPPGYKPVLHLTISDDEPDATALVIIEAEPLGSTVMTEEKDSVIETIKTVVYAVVLAVLIRSVAFEPFNIPSGSMLPNLLVGDYLFISKYSYGYSRFSFPMQMVPIRDRWWVNGAPGGPAQGDIVVFQPPPNPEGDAYIKRVVGLPGDRVQVKGGILNINGQPVERKYIGEYQATGNDGVLRPLKEYDETLPNGIVHRILEQSDEERLDNTPLFEVPQGHYFVMGDNRDNSADSRVPDTVGFVPAANILGPARFFFFSTDADFRFLKPWTWFANIRYERLFRPVPQ